MCVDVYMQVCVWTLYTPSPSHQRAHTATLRGRVCSPVYACTHTHANTRAPPGPGGNQCVLVDCRTTLLLPDIAKEVIPVGKQFFLHSLKNTL